MVLKKALNYLFILLVNPFFSYSQCAMCRAVLESEDSQNMAEGINNGITYLMLIPYLLAFFLGYQIYRVMKS